MNCADIQSSPAADIVQMGSNSLQAGAIIQPFPAPFLHKWHFLSTLYDMFPWNSSILGVASMQEIITEIP
jgi:hypothetical protein